jgi:hypothetical protein
VAIVLDGTLSYAGLRYEITIDLATFVRDVVSESLGSRVLPPIHPPVSAFGRLDAGLR